MFLNVLIALFLAIFIADSLASKNSQEHSEHSWEGNSRAEGCFKVSDTLHCGNKLRFNLCPAHFKEPWSYKGHNGPAKWGEKYPDCCGEEQSPININSTDAEVDEELELLHLINYNMSMSKAKIENNGHTIEIIPNDDVERGIVVNGSRYALRQFHFHWGNKKCNGSEHTIDGIQYTMEMHFVHMNEKNEIAVVGVFFEESEDNEELQNIVGELPLVRYKESETEMKNDLNLENLLPRNPTPFYRYMGSLTTPECAQGVIWSVLPEPIPVGKEQMKEFYRLFSTKSEETTFFGRFFCRLVDNYRPLQPLNGRQVSRSATV